MSSHHIVRDQQEPALVLIDLDAFPFDLLGQLLEWAPYTICGPAALHQALKYEINLDVVYSSDENVGALTSHFPGLKTLPHTEDWLSQALADLRAAGHGFVNVVTAHSFDQLDIMHHWADRLVVDVITPTTKYILVSELLTKWLPSGVQLQLVGEGELMVDGTAVGRTHTTQKEGTATITCSRAPFTLGLSL